MNMGFQIGILAGWIILLTLLITYLREEELEVGRTAIWYDGREITAEMLNSIKTDETTYDELIAMAGAPSTNTNYLPGQGTISYIFNEYEGYINRSGVKRVRNHIRKIYSFEFENSILKNTEQSVVQLKCTASRFARLFLNACKPKKRF